jgi:hypothetical protein
VLFGILLAGLELSVDHDIDLGGPLKIWWRHSKDGIMRYQSLTYFCGFANFLADGFPLVGIVLLDCSKQRCTLLPDQYWSAAVVTRARILTSSSANSA